MRRQQFSGLRITFLMMLLLIPASTTRAQTGDDAALRELTRYLLVATSNGAGNEARTVDLLPAQLPTDLPLALPTPPGARLVGSAVVHTRVRSASWDVIYDAPASATNLNDFYATALPPLGWDVSVSENRPARGFSPAVMGTPLRGLFCANGASLLVNTGPTAAGTLFVRVHLEANGGLCSQRVLPVASGQLGVAADALPGLAAPGGVLLRPAGGSFSADRATSDAIAATSMSAADIEASYARQLIDAGWTRVAGNASGPVAWSTWTVPGPGDLRGYLSVLEVSDQDRRDLHVQVAVPTVRVPTATPTPAAP